MVVTAKTQLPSYEALTVEEVPLGTPYLRAGAMHLGSACEAKNNEFMLCRNERDNPARCLNEGKAVTSCALDFFRKVKGSCAAEFTQYAMCLDKSSDKFEFKYCRKTQAAFDECMKDKLNMERPHYGYHSLTKVHDSPRPKPDPGRPAYMDDPRGSGKPVAEFPKNFPI